MLQICCKPLVPLSGYFLFCLVRVSVAVSFTPTVCWANVNVRRNTQKGLGCSSLEDLSDPVGNPPTPVRSTARKTIRSPRVAAQWASCPTLPWQEQKSGLPQRLARKDWWLSALSSASLCAFAAVCGLTQCHLFQPTERKHIFTLSFMWGGLARHRSCFQLFLSDSHIFLFVAELRKLWHSHSQNIVITSESHQQTSWQPLPHWGWASFLWPAGPLSLTPKCHETEEFSAVKEESISAVSCLQTSFSGD